MTTRRALWGLIAVAAAIRLVWAALLGAGNDEAYHALYTQHFDWSYYDHPPMTACLAALGRLMGHELGTIFPLRIAFVGLFAGSMWLMARVTGRAFGPRAAWIAAFLLGIAGYYPVAAGSFVLPDGPLLFFWLLTIDRFQVAMSSLASRQGSLVPWLGVGLALGGALLSKYHGVLLPPVLLSALLAVPGGRAWLKRPGPYLALAVGLALFAPVIGWNAAHGWASLGFQGGRAIPGGFLPRPDRLAVSLAAQAAYLTPWVWFLLVTLLVAGLRGWRSGTAGCWERLWVAQSIVPIGLFATIGLWRMLLPHWSLVGLLPMFPLAADRLARQFVRSSREQRRLKIRFAAWAGFLVIGMSLALVQFRLAGLTRWLPATYQARIAAIDPTAELYGWSDVAQELRERKLLDDRHTFLFTSRWYHSGQLAFALADRSPVLCYNPKTAQGFSQWSRPEEWVGYDGILLVLNDDPFEAAMFERWFESIEPLAEFDIDRAGASVKHVRLYRCERQTRPFPFNGLKMWAKEQGWEGRALVKREGADPSPSGMAVSSPAIRRR